MKKLILFLLLIPSLVFAGANPYIIGIVSDSGICSTILDGWTLDNVATGINGHDLTPTNITYGTTTPPEGTHYAIFNGTDSALVSASTDFEIDSSDYWASTWINVSTSANAALISQGTTQYGFEITIQYETDLRYLVITHINSYVQNKAITTFSPSLATWYHIVTSYNDTTNEVTVWVSTESGTFGDTLNGVAYSQTQTPISATGNFVVGKNAIRNAINGLMDNPMITIGSTISAANAEILYNGGCQ